MSSIFSKKKHRQQAIMFADVVGSSSLYKKLGNEQAKQAIDYAISLIMELAQNSTGNIIKTIGDEVMVNFPTAQQCCHACIAIQQHFSDPHILHPVSLRIGAAFGEAIEDGGDYFGQAVNDAAAVAKIAKARQIIVTDELVSALTETERELCQWYDSIALKGDDNASSLYRITWEEGAHNTEATVVMSQINLQKLLKNQLLLSLNEQDFLISPADTPFSIGRDARTCNLTINNTAASRLHCEIHFKRGKFVLIDHSTNGTYVHSPEQQEIYLRREELPLTGKGKISIGRESKKNDDELISYCSSTEANSSKS